MDDFRARRVAEHLNLPVVGTLGVLVRAKQAGLVAGVTPLMERLRDELGFFVSDELRQAVRRMAGE